MTTPTHGADVLALRQTAQSMCDAAEDLIAIDLRIGGRLASLTWNGPDAMRARQAWDSEHAPALYRSAKVLVEAGERLLLEADDQEQISSGGLPQRRTPGGGGLPQGPPTGAAGVSVRATLAAELAMVRRLLDDLTPSAETVGQIRAAVVEAVNGANYLNNLSTAAQNVPLSPLVSGGIGALGVGLDAAALQTAWREGDLAGVARSAGSLELSALAMRFPVQGAAAGAAWYVGWEVGEGANRAMAGTRFEENFRHRMDYAFDAIGAWGMLATPVGLAYAGVETLWDTAVDKFSGDDAAGPGVGGR